METITHAFQSLSNLIEVFSILIALAGLFIATRNYKGAGLMIAVGSGLHAVGYFLLTHRDLNSEVSPLGTLLISAMYPGLLLLTLGICYLAYLLPRRLSI